MLFSLFLIFVGAALFATGALMARQSLIIGYILLGVILGPNVLGWVVDTDLIQDISNIGIIFLLFLLGLHLSPNKLIELLRQTTFVTLLSSGGFALIGWAIAILAGFSTVNAIVIGLTCVFYGLDYTFLVLNMIASKVNGDLSEVFCPNIWRERERVSVLL